MTALPGQALFCVAPDLTSKAVNQHGALGSSGAVPVSMAFV